MLLMEEFLCQSSMERTCGQYCSSTVDRGTHAWGRWKYLGLNVETLLRWIILITSAAGGGEGPINLHGAVERNCGTQQD
jgi:hypothetical protein